MSPTPRTPYSSTVFLDSATAEFMQLQSGLSLAIPFYYIEAIVSGVTAVLGQSFGNYTGVTQNYLIDGGMIDRSKPIFPGDRSEIISSDVTLKVDNSTLYFSPLKTGSAFYDNDYLESLVNYWAGFMALSGTALLLQRGSFILTDLKIDSKNCIAYLRLQDRFKRALDRYVGREAEGTATERLFTGCWKCNELMSALLTVDALISGDCVNIQTGEASFADISFSEQTVAQCVSLVAEASDGYVYSNRKGVITFRAYTPVWGSASTPTMTVNESGTIMNTYWEQTRDDRLSKVIVSFGSGTSVSIYSEMTGVTANSKTISNDAIQSTADAVAIAPRFRDRYSGQVTRLELKSVWLPSLEIGDTISVFGNNTNLNGQTFQIHRIEEEPTQGTMTISLSDPLNTGKFCFFSDETEAVSGGQFTGLANELNGWQAEWGFFCNEVTAFDDDGDNDGVVETGVTSSGAGGTGIEAECVFY